MFDDNKGYLFNIFLALAGTLLSAIGVYYSTTYSIIWIQVILIFAWAVSCYLLTINIQNQNRELKEKESTQKTIIDTLKEQLNNNATKELNELIKAYYKYSTIDILNMIEKMLNAINRQNELLSKTDGMFKVVELFESGDDTIILSKVEDKTLFKYFMREDIYDFIKMEENGSRNIVCRVFINQKPDMDRAGIFFIVDKYNIYDNQILYSLQQLRYTGDRKIPDGYYISTIDYDMAGIDCKTGIQLLFKLKSHFENNG